MENLNSIATFNSVQKAKNSLLSSQNLKFYTLYSLNSLIKKLQCSLKSSEKFKVNLNYSLSSADVKHLQKDAKNVKSLYSLYKKITFLQRTHTVAKKINVCFQCLVRKFWYI